MDVPQSCGHRAQTRGSAAKTPYTRAAAASDESPMQNPDGFIFREQAEADVKVADKSNARVRGTLDAAGVGNPWASIAGFFKSLMWWRSFTDASSADEKPAT